MEDMARLAVFEQNVGDPTVLNKTLRTLVDVMDTILKNPHDYELRSINNDSLKQCLAVESFAEYLKYLGFHLNKGTIIYPKEESLSRLRMAQVAIERKLLFINGPYINHTKDIISSTFEDKKTKLVPENILKTNNNFLLHIQDVFNNMLRYEDESLQLEARKVMPVVSLQTKALERIREQQKKIKTGEIQGTDMTFNIALLMELLGWFKYSFFKWVDAPDCEHCGGTTAAQNTISKVVDGEMCRVEIYKCRLCGGGSEFPRYNSPRTLLRSRRGRCGEWANCFCLLLRALRYDVRYILDTTDHVWCEVYDFDSKKWLHVDPCEGTLNTPLMYEHGWKKKIQYVIGFSSDDIQDVTWRYSSHHKEVLKRRNICTESELTETLLILRQNRQKQVSESRKKYLTKRCLEELVQIMVERSPSSYESFGRISGSETWRRERGEIGANKSYIFQLNQPGSYCIRYFASTDKYKVIFNGVEREVLEKWSSATYQCENVFRNEEKDWKMVYLARQEDTSIGNISWKLSTNCKYVRLSALTIRLTSILFENGSIKWSLKFDNEEPVEMPLGETATTIEKDFQDLVISAELSGGRADVAWQHAQLFRQPLTAKSCSLEITTVATKNDS